MWWVPAPLGGNAAEVRTLPDDCATTWWRILARRTGPRLPFRHAGKSHPTKQHMALQVRDGWHGQVLPQVFRRPGEWNFCTIVDMCLEQPPDIQNAKNYIILRKKLFSFLSYFLFLLSLQRNIFPVDINYLELSSMILHYGNYCRAVCTQNEICSYMI